MLSRAIIHYWHGGIHNLTLGMIPYIVQWGSFKYIYKVFWLLIPQDDWYIIPIDTMIIFGVAAKSLRAKSVVKWKSLSPIQPCDPMDYTVHGILQARILEWLAFPFSRGSSQPRDRTQVPHIAGGFFTSWNTREALWANHMLGLQRSQWNSVTWSPGLKASWQASNMGSASLTLWLRTCILMSFF